MVSLECHINVTLPPAPLGGHDSLALADNGRVAEGGELREDRATGTVCQKAQAFHVSLIWGSA